MRFGAGNFQRLEAIGFVDRFRQIAGRFRAPILGLTIEFDAGRDDRRGGQGASDQGARSLKRRRGDSDARSGPSDRAFGCRPRGERNASGNELQNPIEQRRAIARHARRGGKRGRIDSGNAIDDRQAGFGRGSLARVETTIHRGGEHDAASLLQLDEAFAPVGIVGRERRSRDRDQATAFAQPRQRR